jgi:nitronate monooxygenase
MLMGSRMTVASEIWAHENYKNRVVGTDQSGTRVIMSTFRDNSRVMDNRTARAVAGLEETGETDYDAYRALVHGPLQREAYETGDWERGTLSLGQSCVFADEIKPVAAIFDQILAEAVVMKGRLDGLCTAA